MLSITITGEQKEEWGELTLQELIDKGVIKVSAQKMTNEEYLSKGGNYCPFCKSENIEAGDKEFDSNIAWVDVMCNNCGKEWSDEYKLIGYTEP